PHHHHELREPPQRTGALAALLRRRRALLWLRLVSTARGRVVRFPRVATTSGDPRCTAAHVALLVLQRPCHRVHATGRARDSPIFGRGGCYKRSVGVLDRIGSVVKAEWS